LNMYQFIGSSGLAVLTLALTAPVPLISIRYSKQFGLNSGPAATAVNASNAVSFVAILLLAGADFETKRRSLMSLFASLGTLFVGLGIFMNKKALETSSEYSEGGNDEPFEIRDIGDGKKRFVSTNALTRRRGAKTAVTLPSLSSVATPRGYCRTFAVSRRNRNRPSSGNGLGVGAHHRSAFVF